MRLTRDATCVVGGGSREYEHAVHGTDLFSLSCRGQCWYFSQVLPFTIPRMVSGPDFFPESSWRRNIEDAPAVTPKQFCSAFFFTKITEILNEMNFAFVEFHLLTWKIRNSQCKSS